MRITNIAFGLAVCASAACARSNDPKIQHAGISSDEQALAYSLSLLDKITNYVSNNAASQTVGFQPGEIPLSALDLDSPDSSKKVSDLFDTVHMKLSDRYTFTFGDGSSTGNDHMDMMNIPFDNVFTFDSSSIHYMSNVLAILSRLDPVHISSIAPIFGVGSKSIGSSESSMAISRLLNAITEMDPSSRRFFAKASIGNNDPETEDPLSKHVQLFSLKSLASMEKQRMAEVAEFFSSIGHANEYETAKYLYGIGWKIVDSRKVQTNGASADSIPNPSTMFLVQDATLAKMTQAARQYPTSDTGSDIESVKQAVEESLHHVRDFLDNIPGYATISSLIDLSNNPIVNQIVQIISLSYANPDASYLQLALMYYKSIGMPGLQSIIASPSHYVGDLASSYFGSYVSNAIAGVVTNLLFPSGEVIPTATASSSRSAMLLTSTLPTSSDLITSTSSSVSPSTSTGGGWGYWWPFGGSASASTSSKPSPSPSPSPKSTSASILPSLSSTISSSAGMSSKVSALTKQSTSTHVPTSTTSKLSPSTSGTSISTSTSGDGWWPFSTIQNGSVNALSQPGMQPAVPATISKTALDVPALQASSGGGNIYQTTIDLNKPISTHIVYTLSQRANPTLVITLIPPHS